MLCRLVATAARTGTRYNCPRVCIVNGVEFAFIRRTFASASQSEEGTASLLINTERRLDAVRKSLCIPYSLTPNSSEDFKYWEDAIRVANLDAAVKHCGERLLSAPGWVLLYLFSSKVYMPSQAVAATNIMLHNFPKADKVLQPALIILTVRFLARQQVHTPIPNLIKLFLMLDIPSPSTQFNLLLRSMSYFKPHPMLAKATTQVLDAMHGRRIKLHSRTYRSLLSNSLVSLELAKKLQQSMEQQGTKPNRYHLEAYLRVFAHHGAVHASARYLNLIKERAEKTGGVTPHGVELSSRGALAVKSENSVSTRWNTQFLTSFKRNTGSAFQYLRDMVEEKDLAPVIRRTARKESRITSATRKDRPRIWKVKTHVSDWTTALSVAARDNKISSEQLLRLFDETKAAAGYPSTVAVFTVLMRGLAKRGDHATALDVWERCCASWSRRRKIDTKALTVAMDVMVANGNYLSAFDTLVQTTGILLDRVNKPTKLDRTAIGRRYKRALYSKYAKVDVPLVNALMNAYQKNGRPDFVFRLWDVFVPLFGVHPNTETLTILLDAAHSVSRWDRTFRGLLEKLGLHDLFKSASPPSIPIEEKDRRQIVQSMRHQIKRATLPPNNGKSPPKSNKIEQEAQTYIRTTLWNGELAAPKVKKLFQEIVLGNYPELKYIIPPAKAVWPDDAQSASPMRDALNSLGSRLRNRHLQKSTVHHVAPFLRGPTLGINPGNDGPIYSSSPHPQITPSSKCFEAYISLLASTNRASQIPITLAWMRCLGVRPLRRSLATSLALWSEASMRGPLIDEYGGSPSEFIKLRMWLDEWLGQEAIPTDLAISWAFRKLREEREN